MAAYYNENDGFAAEWLRNLIREGHIAPGEVDDRSIADVSADDVRGFRQCHFFAGIGVWSYALRCAGWPDDRPVWTGSCPCQPFSAAGKRQGNADERHLWPAWFRLIRECRPAIVFGEQVASKDALRWLDAVSDDLEGEDYAVGAADLCAPGVGAPHIRQRLFWLADRAGEQQSPDRRRELLAQEESSANRLHANNRTPSSSDFGWLADHNGGPGRQGREELRGRGAGGASLEGAGSCGDGEPCRLADSGQPGLEVERQQPARGERSPIERGGEAIRLANTNGGHAGPERQQRGGQQRQQPQDGRSSELDGLVDAEGERHGAHDVEPVAKWREHPARQTGRTSIAEHAWTGPLDGHWRDADWLRCTDGSWRPTEPGAFPLAHGVAGRVGRLRAYGNAIVAPLATEFIRAAREACREVRP